MGKCKNESKLPSATGSGELSLRSPMLSKSLLSLLAEGIYALPDGRFHISGAHTERDIGKTVEVINQVFKGLG